MFKKNIYLFLFLLLFHLLLNKDVNANFNFLKYENNPLIINENFPEWVGVNQMRPFMLFENNKYKLWYVSAKSDYSFRNRIVYAESDNLNDWNEIQLLKLENVSSNSDPFILKNDSNYILFYVTNNYGYDYKIHKITSSDGKSFDMQNDKVILTPGQLWDYIVVGSPFVTNINSKYFLFYSGWERNVWGIGLAIS